jgi:hypothetical protein
VTNRSDLEQRLRAALTLRWDQVPEGVDMSATAIAHRLREAAEMSALCLALAAIGEPRT